MTTNELNYLDVSGSRLAHDRVGEEGSGAGPDVLFLHGWPLHRATWRDVVSELPNVTSHLVDFPGCGDSVTPAEVGVSLRGHVDATVELIKHLQADQLVLVGNDSGGLIARMAAARLPGQVAGLVLIGTEIPGQHPKLIDQLQLMMRIPGSTAVTRKALRTPWIARNKRMLGGCFWDTDLIEGSFRTEVLAPVLEAPNALDRQLELLQTYSHELVDELFETHKAITCPTLLVWGERDPFFPPDMARAMTDQFAGPTQFEVVPEARLLVHEEQPKRVAQLISTFLDENGLR